MSMFCPFCVSKAVSAIVFSVKSVSRMKVDLEEKSFVSFG